MCIYIDLWDYPLKTSTCIEPEPWPIISLLGRRFEPWWDGVPVGTTRDQAVQCLQADPDRDVQFGSRHLGTAQPLFLHL